MKLVTIFGTRPEIIRLSLIIPVLDQLCEQTLIHTGQNFDARLSDIFFDELQLRLPDIHCGAQGRTFAEQIGPMLARVDETLEQLQPDRVLVLGDTVSGLSAIAAARRRIPVFHLEAGNRCYDERVPEELNRRLIDHASAVLLPYTERSQANLVREGIARERIFVVGNPIYDVLRANAEAVAHSRVLDTLGLSAGRYFLASIHRAENVDDRARLQKLIVGLNRVADTYNQPVIVTLHPRTADRMRQYGMGPKSATVRFCDPFGFFDFVSLEKQARTVLTDSGTVQEECCIFGVPTVTLRDVTERPETIESGSNMLSGCDPERILKAVQVVLNTPHAWTPPPEYVRGHVAERVARIVLGYCPADEA
ncbi:MAG: UDP-N-acetylglucosamine 2-epimerase (non-hydrolyzing) [Vicinamibacteria bacterium]|nr:UDP-N-acetylglucosamine 2-epimerase (non-hydrolyzing) [Vicinamibacteria bacterium]